MEKFQKYFLEFQWPWYMPTAEEYKKLVMGSNFTDINVWGENADRYFNDVEEMARWIDQPSLIPFLKYIDDEKDKKSFRDIAIQKMIDRTQRADRRCFETFRRINILARK